MTQANITATIEEFLKSRYRNVYNQGLDGLATDRDGNFLHYNQIIDQTYNELFKDMHLNDTITDEFKKEFCKYFYNREIGLETFARFQVALENVLNVECFNLFKFMKEIRNKSIDDLNKSIDMRTDADSNGDNQGLGLLQSRPDDRLEAVFTDKYGVIKYADNLQENHGKFENENHSHTTGWNGSSLFDRLQGYATTQDLMYQIFLVCEKLFLQIF